ncbi:hypothetical protein PV387_36320 [Streptomyces sp. ME02-6987-2C]|uniref:hypothetical protein n=1 Tax=unclassified Streptomyces TaxID=2593676 RepID=UPI0029B5D957|nr:MULTISPECIES: hypothetical protein [unclassified Streptomyces]MDX3345951.1 hypothetical protein [Streptomyces sp. ME02-6979A]MDX3371407.1 hypothetical protein [Streptomyces sp. ME02-6987-2C]MDX3411626.1 hypothetical protein [Streptomyces sp. ME02-6977A]MDX3421717.1 hypothetical protein [Streptomyces sp. ME02-6985-2c]
MADDEPAEETQMVVRALEAVTEMDDPVARARAISQVLAYVKEHEQDWRDDRRETVLRLRAEKKSLRSIASMISVSLGTVQSIERGHAGAWRTKPRKKPAPEDQERPSDE